MIKNLGLIITIGKKKMKSSYIKSMDFRNSLIGLIAYLVTSTGFVVPHHLTIQKYLMKECFRSKQETNVIYQNENHWNI